MAIALGLLVLVALCALAAWLYARQQQAAAVLDHPLDTRQAEELAGDREREKSQQEASDVVRSSSDDLRRTVDELRSRGRAGK